jgi:hypothetical protein
MDEIHKNDCKMFLQFLLNFLINILLHVHWIYIQ